MGENYCSNCHKELVTCPTCKGKGMAWNDLRKRNEQCENCNGTGKLCSKHGNDH
ncbi:MAG: hypothetical protein HY265_08330 [Deltaproteobacteria bacterium]|nr:hypothetical protein [Deltaproteobacteria bacterium]